jgi:hypothetical protein
MGEIMQLAAAHLDVVAAQTFGREEAMFQGLLSFMASVSLTLWAMVLLTAIVRFVACHVLYRRPRLPVVLTSRADEESSQYVA